MDFSFSLHHVNQSAIFFEERKIEMYGLAAEVAKNYPNISRCIGLPIAFCSGILTLIERICTIVEGLIKGLANIFGSSSDDNSQTLKGLKQIFVQIPNTIALLLTPATAGIGGLITTVAMLAVPEDYCNLQQESHKTTVNDLKELSFQGIYKGKPPPFFMKLFSA